MPEKKHFRQYMLCEQDYMDVYLPLNTKLPIVTMPDFSQMFYLLCEVTGSLHTRPDLFPEGPPQIYLLKPNQTSTIQKPLTESVFTPFQETFSLLVM